MRVKLLSGQPAGRVPFALFGAIDPVEGSKRCCQLPERWRKVAAVAFSPTAPASRDTEKSSTAYSRVNDAMSGESELERPVTSPDSVGTKPSAR